MSVRELTPNQLAFADHFIILGNATQAYLKAYPNVTKETTASANGSRLLRNARIISYIDERMKEHTNNRIMDAQEALELLTGIARGEIFEEVYIPTEQGVERIEKIPDIRDRQRAIDSLLKRFPANRREELQNQMLEAQINKIKKDTETDTSTEDKLKDYFQALGREFKDDD